MDALPHVFDAHVHVQPHGELKVRARAFEPPFSGEAKGKILFDNAAAFFFGR